MIRYITRHGQVEANRFVDGNPMFPIGDPPLSELGREQARLLGEHMKTLDFHGLIVSSPYVRTLETAQIIAEITDTRILPYAPIREIMMHEDTAKAFRGLTMQEILQRFDRVLPDAQLPWPWWSDFVENSVRDVRPRVKAGLPPLSVYDDRELLFVGHGASAGALLWAFELPMDPDPRKILYNCSLSAIDPADPAFKPYRCRVGHIPYRMQTSNFRTAQELDQEYFDKPYEGEIEVPQELQTMTGERVLHIGDTFSWEYPYYRKLIELVKPDVILHTGDMADEVKVGRIPGTEYEYLTKIRMLLDVMQASGAKLIIVPGNNDLPDEIQSMCPLAQLFPNNTQLNFSGRECRIGHQVKLMRFDLQYTLYGHGLTGETWHFEENVSGQPCRFNVIWGSFVYDFANDRFWLFERPRITV